MYMCMNILFAMKNNPSEFEHDVLVLAVKAKCCDNGLGKYVGVVETNRSFHGGYCKSVILARK